MAYSDPDANIQEDLPARASDVRQIQENAELIAAGTDAGAPKVSVENALNSTGTVGHRLVVATGGAISTETADLTYDQDNDTTSGSGQAATASCGTSGTWFVFGLYRDHSGTATEHGQAYVVNGAITWQRAIASDNSTSTSLFTIDGGGDIYISHSAAGAVSSIMAIKVAE